MEAQIVYLDGCPNWVTAQQRLAEALTRVGLSETSVALVAVTSAVEAASGGFAGSPTILVNGEDLVPGMPPPGDLACRLYATSQGPAGCPTVEDQGCGSG